MLEFAITVARRAGALLMQGLDQRPAVELKSSYEVVTAVDRASEALIVQAITETFPDHAVVAEEGSGVDRVSDYRWIIDPLDGTNNYAHGFPFFCVSLGLLHYHKLFIGVVYDPLRDELFTAQAGQGSWCNGRKLQVSSVAHLAGALVSTGFPYDYATSATNNLAQFNRIQRCTQGVRRGGSAALDLAYVAAGRLEAHWEIGLKPWDSAAAALMVVEAGGTLSELHGANWTPWSADLAATNGQIHSELLAALTDEV
jgi:myo-inositol-1(or 4)-monophosphatase